MAEKLRLNYFPIRARGEIIRILLHAANVEFEDHIIAFEEWPKIKPTTPYGSLPVIKIQGKDYSQGMALATYLAREHGLYGKNNLEGLQIDVIQQLREDLMIQETNRHIAFSSGKKDRGQEIDNDLKTTLWPRFLGFFNKIIKDNGTGFAVGNKLTLADVVIFEGTQSINLEKPDLIDKYPEVKALRAKVASVPSIKKYLSSKTVVPF